MTVGIPCIIIGLSGALIFSWHNVIWILAIPILPIAFLMGKYPANIIFAISKTFYKINTLTLDGFKLLKPKLRTYKNAELMITPKPNYSRLRTWWYVCLVPLMLAICLSNLLGLDIGIRGIENTTSGSILITSVLFMPVFMIIGIPLSIIDSSNLLIPSKRGERTLASKRLTRIIPIIFLITTFYNILTQDQPEDADYYRAIIIFALFNSAAVFYMVFLEKQFVQNFRRFLIKERVQAKDPSKC